MTREKLSRKAQERYVKMSLEFEQHMRNANYKAFDPEEAKKHLARANKTLDDYFNSIKVEEREKILPIVHRQKEKVLEYLFYVSNIMSSNLENTSGETQ